MTTTIRTSWPQVRSHEVKGHTYWLVDTRRIGLSIPRKTFVNQVQALNYASEIAEKFSNEGKNGLTKVDFVLTDQVKKWMDQLSPYGKDVEWAVNFASEYLKKQAKVTKTTAEYLQDWRNEKLNNKMKPLRPASIRNLNTRVSFFTKHFNGNLLTAIADKEWLRNWFNSLECNNNSRSTYRRYLNDFFNWTLDKGLLDFNPCKFIQIETERGEIEAYTVEQSQELIKAATDTKFLGFVSLCLFAGIRPAEASKLTWDNIDFEHSEITIPKNVSKVKKERIIQCRKHGLMNLMEWLKTHKATNQTLIPEGFDPDTNLEWKSFKGSFTFDWIQDGMRHTFAGFHYAKHQSYEALKAIMGTGDTYLRGNYQKAISSKTVDSFWSIPTNRFVFTSGLIPGDFPTVDQVETPPSVPRFV